MKPFDILFLSFCTLMIVLTIKTSASGDYDRGYHDGLVGGMKLSMLAVEKICPSKDHYLQKRFIAEVTKLAKRGIKK